MIPLFSAIKYEDFFPWNKFRIETNYYGYK